MIGVTQPRRVAAVSLAKRVSEELGTALGDEVGYQIRYDTKNFSAKTNVKFMTDGILLKEIESDFLLRKYSVLVIDEAHERSLNSDILISLLTRIAHKRTQMAYEERKNKRDVTTYPLRLVIMSATLRVADFRENERLFPRSLYEHPPNMINVEARQFPVSVHYAKTTPTDYVEAACRKTLKICDELPPGGILVFLTGKKEIAYM
jgi:ATP-dependent RNA helicase DHX37/DHR1